MHSPWQLQEAKNRLSEVIDTALNEGPQEIIRLGKKTVVVISIEEYRRLKRKQQTLTDFFRNSPLAGMTFDRNATTSRKIEL